MKVVVCSSQNEVQIWKNVVGNIVAANVMYAKRLTEAQKILLNFSKLKYEHVRAGVHSIPAAEKVVHIVSRMRAYHKGVLGDITTLTGAEGPFGQFLTADSADFESLKSAAAENLNDHQQLELASRNAWKYYEKRMTKLEKLSQKLCKTMPAAEVKEDRQYVRHRNKVELALQRYNSYHKREVRRRQTLEAGNHELKRRFLASETSKLEMMFSAINELLTRMQKLVPQGLEGLECDYFEREAPRTTTMAKVNWNSYLSSYVFPTNLLFHEARLSGVSDDDSDSDEFEDEPQGDSSSDEDDDDDDENGGPETHGELNPGHVAGETSTGLNPGSCSYRTDISDALEEILNSLDPTEEIRMERRSSSDDSEAEESASECERQDRHDESSRDNTAWGENSLTDDNKVERQRPMMQRSRGKGQASSARKNEATSGAEPENGLSCSREITRSRTVSPQKRFKTQEWREYGKEPGNARSRARGRNTPEKRQADKSLLSRLKEATWRPSSHSDGTNILVYALADRKKTSENEISLRLGMALTQTSMPNHNGIVYGYKKSRSGLKKHGYFPYSFVSKVKSN